MAYMDYTSNVKVNGKKFKSINKAFEYAGNIAWTQLKKQQNKNKKSRGSK